MGFKGCDFLRSIVVVDSDLEVIRTADNPIFAGDESPRSYRYIGKLEGFDNCLYVSALARSEQLLGRTCVS